ncbi:transcriptional regulator [Rhizobium sp. BK251]|uniref:transcriptional regulator n=1 Tax=Rhizobium sp. BK251 TaxID=2512125 RepID=UPI001047F116|nr:transcriptional regulator [Rhizobium sp. BK251]TCL65722.1 hypothetical protein EV286_11240 [Rhizobium sp. BK251]
MADEIDTMTNSDAPAIVELPAAAKKQRRPRGKNAAPQAASANGAAEPAVDSTGGPEKQNRGRKTKSVDSASSTKSASVKRAPKAVQANPAAPTAPSVSPVVAEAGDEMADLLQLEEENQKLRKLLAEKLRAENADLRRRLKLD